MPNIPEEVRQRFNTPSFQQLHRYYQKILRRNRFKGNPTRSLDANQLEYAHDSSAYRPPVSDPPPKKISAPTSPTDSPHYYADSPLPQPVTLPPVVYLAFDKKEADKTAQRIRNAAIVRLRNKLNAPQPTESKEELPDIAESGLPDAGSPPVSVAPVLQPLTEGQRVFVEVRKVTESDEGLQSVLATLLIEGLPPEDRFEEFLSQFSAWDRDEESNQLMLGLLEEVTYSNFDAYLQESDVLPYLNERTREYLEEHFPEESLTTRDDLQRFVEKRFRDYVPELKDVLIEWDKFSAEGLIMFYAAALAATKAVYLEEQVGDRINEVARELDIIDDLLEKVAKTPLEDINVLLDTYGLQREEYAVPYFRRQVELIHTALGDDLPENWAEYQDALVLANMLHDGIERLYSRQESDETFLGVNDPAMRELHIEYSRGGYRTIDDEYVKLSAIQTPDLYPYLRFIIGFIDPIDMVLTFGEVYNSLFIQRDLGAAAKDALGFLPGVPGGINKLASKTIFPAGSERFLGRVLKTFSGLELLKPDDPQSVEANFTYKYLEELQTHITESNEIPSGWTELEWSAFLDLLDPESGQMTQNELMAALSLGFRSEIRRELERQQ